MSRPRLSRPLPRLPLAFVVVVLGVGVLTPVLADELRVAAAPAPRPEGWLLSASLEAGLLERDLYLVSNPALGYLSPGFDVILTLPLELLVGDLAPADRERALWGLLRRRAYTEAEQPGWPDLSRLLRSVRIGEHYDLFYLRAGRVHHSLGHGAVMWRYASTPDVDRRHSGAVLRFGTDVVGLEAVVGDVLAPQRVSGARAYLRPLLLLSPQEGLLQELGRRLALGLGYAADWTAPLEVDALTADGSYHAAARTAAIVHGFADAEVLISDWAPLTAAAYADGGARLGPYLIVGFGGETGLLLRLQLFAATLALRAGLRLCSDGYRVAEFDGWYELERLTLPGSGVPKASRDAPAGVAGVVELELALNPWVAARLQLDDTPGRDNSNALLGLDITAGPVRGAAMVAQRSFEGAGGLARMGDHTLAGVELRVEVWDHLALVGRYWRTLRHTAGATRLDNDVLLGLEVGGLLQ